jgi:hypothetical protein
MLLSFSASSPTEQMVMWSCGQQTCLIHQVTLVIRVPRLNYIQTGPDTIVI